MPEITLPVQKAEKKITPPVKSLQLGDGYEQTFQNAIADVEEWNVTTPPMDDDDTNALEDLLNGLNGDVFTWTPPYSDPGTYRLNSKITRTMVSYQRSTLQFKLKLAVYGTGSLYLGITAATGDQGATPNCEHKILEWSVDVADIIGLNEFGLGGSAIVDSGIRLTSNADGQAGSIFYLNQLETIDDFSSVFKYQIIDGGSRNDGLAFVITSDSFYSLSGGGYLGYGTFNKKVAIEFDIFQNEWDSSDNHIAVNVAGGGVMNDYYAINNSIGIDLVGTRWVWIDYVSQNLKVYIAASNSKPMSPIIDCDININQYL